MKGVGFVKKKLIPGTRKQTLQSVKIVQGHIKYLKFN